MEVRQIPFRAEISPYPPFRPAVRILKTVVIFGIIRGIILWRIRKPESSAAGALFVVESRPQSEHHLPGFISRARLASSANPAAKCCAVPRHLPPPSSFWSRNANAFTIQ